MEQYFFDDDEVDIAFDEVYENALEREHNLDTDSEEDGEFDYPVTDTYEIPSASHQILESREHSGMGFPQSQNATDEREISVGGIDEEDAINEAENVDEQEIAAQSGRFGLADVASSQVNDSTHHKFQRSGSMSRVHNNPLHSIRESHKHPVEEPKHVPQIIFIVPYRDREKHYNMFSAHMKTYLDANFTLLEDPSGSPPRRAALTREDTAATSLRQPAFRKSSPSEVKIQRSSLRNPRMSTALMTSSDVLALSYKDLKALAFRESSRLILDHQTRSALVPRVGVLAINNSLQENRDTDPTDKDASGNVAKDMSANEITFVKCKNTRRKNSAQKPYKILYIHQTDKRGFNRGAMKNIGYLVVKDLYPDDYKNITLVFNDVDTMPSRNIVLNYATKPGVIKHFYGFTHTLGGIISVNASDFEKLNGFPNFWAWGYEDNLLQIRAENAKIQIDRSVFYKIQDPRIIHLVDTPIREVNRVEFDRFLNRTTEGISSLRDLTYKINDETGLVDVLTFESEVQEKIEARADYDLRNGPAPFKPTPKPVRRPQMKMLF